MSLPNELKNSLIYSQTNHVGRGCPNGQTLSELRARELEQAKANFSVVREHENRARAIRRRLEKLIYDEEYAILTMSEGDQEVEQYVQWLAKARMAVACARQIEHQATIELALGAAALTCARGAEAALRDASS